MKKLLTIMIAIMLSFTLGACYNSLQQEPTAHDIGQQATEEVVQDLISTDTLPKITRSLERENIKRRIEFINQPDRIGYLYLLSDNGVLIREEQVLGKVSSLNSYLTPMEEIKQIDHVDLGEAYGTVYLTVQAPDLDGSYGENQNGIFWFTPDGVYREWTGLYLYSAERLTFTTPPLLISVAD